MISFLHGSSVLVEIKKLVGLESKADLAVAYWGAGAFETLGIRGDKPVRILCDLMSAGCNPKEIEKTLTPPYSPKVEVKHVPRLHSKVYISGSSVIVGSPNASSNGLGEQPWSNIEAAIFTDDATPVLDAQNWFNEIWLDETRSQKVTRSLIEKSKKVPRPPLRSTFLEELVSNPHYFGKSVTLVYIDNPASREANNVFYENASSHYSEEQRKYWTAGSEPFYQAGYPKEKVDRMIEPGHYVINCAYEDMAPESVKEPGTIPISPDDCIVLMNEPSKRVLGLPFPSKQRRMLHRAAQRYLDAAQRDGVQRQTIKDEFSHSIDEMSAKLRKLIEDELANETKPSKKQRQR